MLWNVVLIGIVEGITEWLPISSTGHMLLLDQWMPLPMSESFKEMFFVVIQLGAILAVVTEFWKRLWPVAITDGRLRPKWDVLHLWYTVAIGCFPAGVLGLLLDEYLEAHFGTPRTIAAMLILYGVLFIAIESSSRTPTVYATSALPFGTVLAIGLFQALAMIPGTSRSGATIIGALLLGVSRTTASEFSFFLAIPTMLGASTLKLVKFGFAFQFDELCVLFVGMVTAFAVSLLSIRFLMGFTRRHSFKLFGWYRIALGLAVLAFMT